MSTSMVRTTLLDASGADSSSKSWNYPSHMAYFGGHLGSGPPLLSGLRTVLCGTEFRPTGHFAPVCH
jgi:hypothetical protein